MQSVEKTALAAMVRGERNTGGLDESRDLDQGVWLCCVKTGICAKAVKRQRGPAGLAPNQKEGLALGSQPACDNPTTRPPVATPAPAEASRHHVTSTLLVRCLMLRASVCVNKRGNLSHNFAPKGDMGILRCAAYVQY